MTPRFGQAFDYLRLIKRMCSTLHRIFVERPCSLSVRSNTKTAPVGATQSIKVITNESSLYFTV